MKDNLIIREAQPSDAEAVLRYLNRVGGESNNLLFGENEATMTIEQEADWIRGRLEHPRSCFLLGFLNGALVATAGIAGTDRPRISHRGNLSLVVSKSCWGQGIGRRMMEALIDYGRKAGLTVLDLEVRTDNEAAIHLYERLGFRSFGVYPKFGQLNGAYYDCAYMTLEL